MTQASILRHLCHQGNVAGVMPSVEVTRHLFQFFPHLAEREIEVTGATVADVVAELESLAPGIGFYLCDERGRLRKHVNIFVNNEAIRDRGRLSDPVDEQARVFIMQALSGG